MRPEKLTFSGLRSYYGTAEVDFSDLGLFAIIGDTGSGKSTIIEALSLALYARPTWSGQIEGLVSDGATAWQVELTFVAGGNRWRVTRKRGRGSPVDKLEQLDGGSEKADGKAAVNVRVEEIIGLNHSQFTSSVVLPQGRFEKLLVAKETERTQLLTSILGLDDLEATQRMAKELIDEWRPQVQAWEEVRRSLGDDPSGDLERAAAAATDAGQRAEALAEAASRLGELEPQVEAAGSTHQRLSDLLSAITELPGDLGDELAGTQARWALAARELAGAESDLAAVRGKVEALRSERVKHLGAFENRDDLVAAFTGARRIAEQLPERLQDAEDARARLQALGQAAPAATVDQALVKAAESAKHRAEASEGALTTATAALTRGEQALRQLVEFRSRLAELEAAAPAAAQRLEGLRGQLEHARLAAEAAERTAKLAADAVRAALIESAAAQAGEGCRPGDDCPVCARPLPESYVPPARLADVDAAESAEHAAARDLQKAKHDVAELDKQVDRGADAEERRKAEMELAQEAVQVAVDSAEEAGVAADAASEEAALADLVLAVGTARQEHADARSSFDAAELERTAAQSEVDRLSAEHQRQVAQAEADVRSAEGAVETLVEELAGVPVSAGEPLEPAQRAEAVRAVLELQREALDEVDRQLEDLADAERDANTTRNGAVDRVSEEREAAKRLFELVRERHAAIAAAYDAAQNSTPERSFPELPDEPAVISTHEQLALVCAGLGGMLSTLAAAVGAIRGSLDELAERRDALKRELHALLESAGYSTSNELLTASGGANVAAGEAERNLERASEVAEKAARLDERLSAALPFLANLRVLNEALRNTRFVAHLVATRQTELLAEASQRLSEITGGRFGFGEDFKVINRHSGEQRRPDALSGGERFQAALALALALMEIASRGSRGRLEAVFIDEGFGSLDGAALEQALDRLRAVSGDGTTVALVSHLRAVAEHVNDVLQVTRNDTTGSQVKKLEPEELERMLDDDVRSGLTA